MGINLLLDFIFIIRMGFGVRAAAISNVMSKLVGLVMYIVLCRKEIRITLDRFAIYKRKMMATIKGCLPLMGQELLEGSVFSLAVLAIIARIGDYHLAAYLILTLILSFVMMPVYMYGSAILTLASQIDSSREEEKFFTLPKTGLILSLLIYIVVAVLLYIFRDVLPLIVTDNTDVVDIAAWFFAFMLIARLFEIVSTIYRYSLQVIGQSKFVLYQTAIFNLLTVIILVTTTQVFNLGLYGVFVCLLINYTIVSIVYILKYNKTIRLTYGN